jgi:hypothetical protein
MNLCRIQKLGRSLSALFGLYIILGLINICAALAQAIPAGSVTSVSGTVRLQRGGNVGPLAQGAAVFVGDRITTGDDGHIVVQLSDHSTLELSDSSDVAIDQHAGTVSRVNLAAGTLRSFVNRAAGSSPEFEVHTPNAVAAARGTRFDTSFTANDTRPNFADVHQFTDVGVYDGTVYLANVNSLSTGTDILAGYESTVAGNLNPTSPQPLSANDKLTFKKAAPLTALGLLGAGGLGAGIYFADSGGNPNAITVSPSK